MMSGTSAARKPSRFIPTLILTNTSSGRVKVRMLEQAHLFGVVNDDAQSLGRDVRQLGGGEESFEQQNAASVVRCSQRNRCVEFEQREAVGIDERRQHADGVRARKHWP